MATVLSRMVVALLLVGLAMMQGFGARPGVGSAADPALLAPFNYGVAFQVNGEDRAGGGTYNGGYYNNRSQSVEGCHIIWAPDHCRNQLFGLDLRPDDLSDTDILAPAKATVDYLPGSPTTGTCLGLTLEDGVHLNLCHFSGSVKVKYGDSVQRGQLLGTRAGQHVHISMDDRSRYPYLPIPFNGAHTFEGSALDPDPNGEAVSYANRTYRAAFGQYHGWRGVSHNIKLNAGDDGAARRGQISELYQSELCRTADASGLDYHDRTGRSLDQIKQDFRNSAEGQRVAAVRQLYLDLLGRGGSCPEIRGWVESGQIIEQIRQAIKASPEYCRTHPCGLTSFSVDMGVPSSEAPFNLQGWGGAEGPGVNPYTSPTGDRTKRFQRYQADNTLTFAPVNPGQSYRVTAEVEDGSCDDSFQIMAGGALLYDFAGHRTTTVIRTHRVAIPGNAVGSPQLVVTFRNTARDGCGLAAVFNVRLEAATGGPATYSFSVDSRLYAPGLDTGVDLQEGQRIGITATGRVGYGGEGSPCSGYPLTDPDGNRYLAGSTCPPKIDPSAPLPTAPIGALLGRIGNGSWFPIGSSLNGTVQGSGRLFLLYNDTYRGDNSGSYEVQLTLQP